ncbi:Unannotated [Lentimonas sp. CC19]|nr:Unannotated [Lentimonas sp. CC10]CAA6693977.1 Unannotated [Lentimonas sp. CC19]CAA7070249.1 Unannotated [Lentimonas sp. CC11]
MVEDRLLEDRAVEVNLDCVLLGAYLFWVLNRYSVAQKSGAVGCALGFAWMYLCCVQPLVQGVFRADDWIDLLLECAMPVALGILGLLLIAVSLKLMRSTPTRDGIKNLFGVLCGFGTFLCAFGLLPTLYRLVSGRVDFGLFGIFSLVVSLLIMLPLYAGLSKFVMKRSGIVSVPGEFVGSGCYLIFALLLWQVLQALLMDHREVLETGTLLDMLIMLVPFVVPYIAYRLAVKYLVRDTIDQQVALDSRSSSQRSEV